MKTYSELLEQLDGVITYSDLLLTSEWRTKREEILNRDKYQCTDCQVISTAPENIRDHYRSMTPEEEEAFIIEQIEEDKNSGRYKWLEEEFEQIGKKFKPKYAMPLVQIDVDANLISNALHVHHKYYIKGNLPWEYDNETLISVCESCHADIHESTEIPVYLNLHSNDRVDTQSCDRCGGIGEIPKYRRIQNGICFKCFGLGYLENIDVTLPNSKQK